MTNTPATISALIVLLATGLAAQQNSAKPSGAEEIHIAAAAGDLNKVRALLEADPTLLESKDNLGFTPLHSACLAKQAAVAKFLLDKGANVNARDYFDLTPLHRASYDTGQHVGLIQLLLDKGADVNAQGGNGNTPLHFAALKGDLKAAKLLLDHGADVNAEYSGAIQSSSVSGTVLQVAINFGPTEEMAKWLVENGAKLNRKDSNGNAELHLAALKGYADLVRLLVQHGADVNAVNKYNRTALYYAAKHGYRSVAAALIAAGAKKSAIVETNYGKAPQLAATLKEGEAYLWKIGYLGYAVKTKGHLILFNPKGVEESLDAGLANGHLNPSELAGQKITILITEPEKRQQGTEGFELSKRMPGVDFVASRKPAASGAGNPDVPPYRLAVPNESFSVGGIRVHTIPALAGGMGYLVEADGVKVFHAGLHVSDNNASNVARFRKEIDFLKPFGPIDIAILSVHSHSNDIGIAYEQFLYLLDQLSPKAVYLLGANIPEEYTECAEVLRARDVPVTYPEGGIAIGERFHYLRDQALTTPLVGTDRDSPHASSVRSSYLEERARFHSKLIRRGPAPGSQSQPTPPAGIETITYASGDLKLRAWLSVPEAGRVRPAPALVFLHGGSEQSAFFVERAQAFRDAGFVVLFPMLRGENGNPGEWECLLGEIDDAAAAVRWIAAQAFVDPAQIYTYGHSTGAAVSLLVSLRDDLPVRLSGSSAGLYTADSLREWTNAPFDVNDERERRMRTPIEFIQTMGQRHVTFVGRDEHPVERVAEFRRLSAGSKLEIREVTGDHMGCLQPALDQFLRIVLSDIATKQR
jgi:ankyrin repeat protein/acetyl esterase/lipase